MTITQAPSRWSAITAFALVGAATQIAWLSYAPVTTVAAQHFGVSESDVGWLANMFPLLYVLLAIPAGMVLDRWFRGGLLAGAVLTAVGATLRLVDDTFMWALIGQTLVAVAQPLVLNAITGISGRYLREKDRPKGIAIGTAATFAGMVIAFVLGAVLPTAADLTTLVGIGAGVSVLAALVLAGALRTPGAQRHASPPAGFGALRVAVSDPFIRKLCLLVFFPFGTFVALTTFGQALLEPAGVAAETASIILLINVVAGVAGCAIVPVVAVKRRAELRTVLYGLLVSALACVALALAPSAATGFIALLLIGFVLLPALPIVLELVERRTGEAEGTAAGLVWMAGNLGGLIVALVVGLAVDQPVVAFLVCAVAALGGIPALRLLRPHLRDLPAVGAGHTNAPVAGTRAHLN